MSDIDISNSGDQETSVVLDDAMVDVPVTEKEGKTEDCLTMGLSNDVDIDDSISNKSYLPEYSDPSPTSSPYGNKPNEEEEGLISNRFARNNRMCWGGMKKWLFWVIVALICCNLLLVIFTPVLLYEIMPLIAQHNVDDSTLSATNIDIQSWDVVPGSIEAQHYETFLPIFAKKCKEAAANFNLTKCDKYPDGEALKNKEFFLNNATLKDTLCCVNEYVGAIFEYPSKVKGKTSVLAALSTFLGGDAPLAKVGSLTWREFFDSVNIQSCSAFNPASVQGKMDVHLTGIPSFLKGSLSESYIDLYGHHDDPATDKPFGRIAIPEMSLNNIEGDARVVKDVKFTIKVFDRIQFLMNNFNLLNLDPFTTGETIWKQVGTLGVNIDFGKTYHIPVNLNKDTKLSNAVFSSGPFSVRNHNAKVDINDPFGFLGCMILDVLPSFMDEEAESPLEFDTLKDMFMGEESAFAGVDFLGRRRRSSDNSLNSKPTGLCNIADLDMNNIDMNDPEQVKEVYKCMGGFLHSFFPKKLTEKLNGIESTRESNRDPVQIFQNFNMEGSLQGLVESFLDSKSAKKTAAPSQTRTRRDTKYDPFTSGEYGSCTMDSATGEECKLSKLSGGPYVVYPEISTNTIDGIKPTCLFGDDYGFTVHEGKGENKSKLLLYFQGGGADWDNIVNDLNGLKIMKSSLETQWNFDFGFDLPDAFDFTTGTADLKVPKIEGVFDQSNPANPFATWTIVQVLYCSGDVHAGNQTKESIAPLKIIDTHYRHGYVNTMSVLNWILKQDDIKVPTTLVMMGCSAGALGAQVWNAKVQQMLGATSGNTALFVDSYVGVFPNNNSTVKHTTGKFDIVMDQTDNKCYNVSQDYGVKHLLSAPIGSVVNNDWKLCDVMGTVFGSSASKVNDCKQNKFDIVEFFGGEFDKLNAPVHFIQSKADKVQRLFGALVDFTVTRDAGMATSNNDKISVNTFAPNLDVCKDYKDNKGYTHCEKLDSCAVPGIQNEYRYYNNVTLTKRDPENNLYLMQLLRNIDGASSLRSILGTLIEKLFSSIKDFMMSGGVHGHGSYWKKGKEILEKYKTKKKTWFVPNNDQHCFTCYDALYKDDVTVIGNSKLLDWIQEGVNNAMSGNKKIVAKITAPQNKDYPTDLLK
eukprot:Pgem_evm1s4711